ncbi:MAG: hypothetical protein M1813_004163 [Trichoglossum hirsutum]|nr:MAG: hypothetical protein M1813_004163 [Trichoglossum hirsutum]
MKQALVQAAEGSQDDINILMSCYAVVFFGVPNRGLNIPSLTSMVSGQPNEDLVRNLNPSSPFLGLLHEMFYRHFVFDDSQIVCFYETQETPTIEFSRETGRWERTGPRVMMVPKASAIHAGKNEQTYNHLPIDADHSDMVKFNDPSDQNYIVIEKRIEKLADDAPGIIKERIAGHNKKLSDMKVRYVRALSAPNYAAVKDRVEDPAQGTFQWILHNGSVRSWLSKDESSVLWIRGSPGQGKTVLSKFLLNHWNHHPPNSQSNAKIIYFFCYDQDEGFRTATSILRSLIKQLLTNSNLLHHMSDTFDTGSFSPDSEDSLWEILQSMFGDSSLCAIYCIVDALDECDEGSRKRLLGRITRLIQTSAQKRKRGPILKLLITSRPIMDISVMLSRFPYIDLKANPDDLKLVIKSKVRSLSNLSTDLQEMATTLLLNRAEQTFLWATIVLKRLGTIRFPSPARLMETVEESPTDLNKLYQSIVDQVMEGEVEEKMLLTWVVYGRRPLTLEELEAALAIQETSRTRASTDKYRAGLTAKAVTSAMGVILDITDNRVHLIHQSAKDFLLRNNQLNRARLFRCQNPNIYLAKVCIIYLSFEDFEIGPCGDRQSLAARKCQYPLLDYAARNWHTHLRGREDVDEVSYLLDRLIKPRSPILLAWAEAADIPDLRKANDTWGIATNASIAWLSEFRPSNMITEEMVKQATGNRVTAHEVMKRFVSGSDTMFTEGAVHEIARSFDAEMMRLLLARNDCIIITPSLTKAAAANRKNGDSVVRSLLDLSKDIELTADLVEVAAKNQESGKEVIGLLLRKDIKIKDGAVAAIVHNFDAQVVRLLPENQDGIKVTELVVKEVAGNRNSGKEIMQLLLGRGDVHLTDGAVAAILRQFGVEVVELLLRRNDIEIREDIVKAIARRFDTKIMRPLLEKRGHVEVTEVVVEAAAGNRNNGKKVMELLLSNVGFQITQGVVAAIARHFDASMMGLLLSKGIPVTEAVVEAAAINEGSGKEVVEFLLGRGDILIVEMVMKAAPSNMKGGEPLSRSAENGHKVVVQLLLEKYGVHPDSRDRRGWTPLSWAAQNGHIEVVEMLLAANVDVNAAAAKGYGRTALQAAAGGGHLEVVERLLAANADVNAAAATGSDGRTALQAAAGGGHLEVVERLLAANADVNAAAAAGSNGRTALQAAAGGGHLKVVERLLAANADVNAATRSGQTALQTAAGGGHLEVVERLLAADANVNAAAGRFASRTALQAAAEGGHLEVVNLLLTANADVNTVWSDRTALQAAAGGGHLEVVKRLLAANADVNAGGRMFASRTALQAAAEGGHLEVVNLLLTANADVNTVWSDRTALQAAASKGHLEVVERLLTANADVNAAPEFSQTALQAAAGGGHPEVVERLLAANADVNATGESDKTALQAAAAGGYLKVVERLLTANADVNAAAGFSRTALQAAARGGYPEVVERLLEANADVNATGKSDKTALQAAAGRGHLEVVERLLAADADVNATGKSDKTALQAAAGRGHLEVVERLLAADADVNATGYGQTALQAAAGGGHLEVVERLLATNADTNAPASNYSGRTALQAAAEGGHLEVIERLFTANADVNAAAAAEDGRTALQAAAEGGHLEVIERLFKANADVNAAAAKDGRTALQAAAGGGHLEVIEKLLAANADVNAAAAAEFGRTALQAAAGGGHLEAIERLLAANADVNAAAAAEFGGTALQEAAGGGHLEVVERLLAANADVNAAAAAGSDGRTALQAAAGGGHLEVVERLLAANADVNAAAAAKFGGTALQEAAGGGHLEVVERLLAANADVNAAAATGSGGRTALRAAAGGGHLKVVERLLIANANVNATARDGQTALQAAARNRHFKVVERLKLALDSTANHPTLPAGRGSGMELGLQ